MSEGADADLIAALREKIEEAGGSCKVVAPAISGVTLSDGSALAAV